MRLSTITILYLCLHFYGANSFPQSSSSQPDENKSLKTFHRAIKDGNENEFRKFLSDGVNVNAVDDSGNSALILAAKRGQESMVKKLIEMGADINATNLANDSALIIAASKGYQKIVEMLIENGASINIQDKQAELSAGLVDLIEGVSRSSQRACSMYSVSLDNRILGGMFAESEEFPWMAALGYLNQNDQLNYECGATIISETFLVTAAHCTRSTRPPVRVRYGTLSLTDPSAQRRLIQEIIRHPEYSAASKKNDIALIRVTEPIQFTDGVRPACLHTDMNDINKDTPLVITGWGSVSAHREQLSNDLLKTSLWTMPLDECNKTMVTNFPLEPALRHGISASQYCAYDPNGKSDSCQGDSGGPLQLIQPNSMPSKIVGIVSFGVSCGTKMPSIYTRIAYHLEWIESHVWPNGVVSIPNFILLIL